VRLYSHPDGGPPISVRRAADFLAQVQWPDGSNGQRFRFLGTDSPALDRNLR
jgi:hypothetical protein